MSFWNNVAGSQPAAPAPQPQQQVSSGPWWRPEGITPQHQPQYQQQNYQSQEEADAIASAMAKARSSKSNERCPNCDSGNYTSVNNSAKRCFQCGYNGLGITNAESGVHTTKGEGPVYAAKQVVGGTTLKQIMSNPLRGTEVGV